MSLFRRLSLSRLDDRELCRRLTLEGWELLVAADDKGGVVLVCPAAGPWPVTVAAVGLYRGPVDVVARGPELRALPHRWRSRFVGRVLAPEDAGGPASATLGDGGRVLIVAEPGTDDRDGLAVRLSSKSGAAMLSAVADCPRRRRYRIVVRPAEGR